MSDTEKHLNDLDVFFEAAKQDPPMLSQAALDRILADADATLASAKPQVAPKRASRGLLSRLWAEIGGWQAASGMGLAAAVGLFVGYVDPLQSSEGFATLSGGAEYDVVDLLPLGDDLWFEG